MIAYPQGPGANTATILAVDDEPFNLDSIVRALPTFYVARYERAEDALANAVKLKPLAVLADFRMPGLNGVMFTHELRKLGIWCPVIMVTAFADLEEVIEARKANFIYTVVVKPWKPDQLLVQVELAVRLAKMQAAKPPVQPN